MLPHEKELVKLHSNEAFALLGVNSDEPADEKLSTRENVQRIMAKEGITWRQAIDGSTSGPWATKWNIHGWPTIYVIDHKGVIRFKNVRDEEMTKAVETLLAELKTEKK